MTFTLVFPNSTPAVFAVFFRVSSSIIHVVASAEVFVVAKVVLSP